LEAGAGDLRCDGGVFRRIVFPWRLYVAAICSELTHRVIECALYGSIHWRSLLHAKAKREIAAAQPKKIIE
jgi:hypothetical protein